MLAKFIFAALVLGLAMHGAAAQDENKNDGAAPKAVGAAAEGENADGAAAEGENADGAAPKADGAAPKADGAAAEGENADGAAAEGENADGAALNADDAAAQDKNTGRTERTSSRTEGRTKVAEVGEDTADDSTGSSGGQDSNADLPTQDATGPPGEPDSRFVVLPDSFDQSKCSNALEIESAHFSVEARKSASLSEMLNSKPATFSWLCDCKAAIGFDDTAGHNTQKPMSKNDWMCCLKQCQVTRGIWGFTCAWEGQKTYDPETYCTEAFNVPASRRKLLNAASLAFQVSKNKANRAVQCTN